MLSERKTAEEARNACTDAEARSAELQKKLEDSERKVDQLQESMQRSEWKRKLFEYKLAVLHNKILKERERERKRDSFISKLISDKISSPFSYPFWLSVVTKLKHILIRHTNASLDASVCKNPFLALLFLYADLCAPCLTGTFLFNIILRFRLEEKLANSECEIQVLRQQALAISPTGKSLTTRQRTMIIPV